MNRIFGVIAVCIGAYHFYQYYLTGCVHVLRFGEFCGAQGKFVLIGSGLFIVIGIYLVWKGDSGKVETDA